MHRLEINPDITPLYLKRPSTELLEEIRGRAEKMGRYTNEEFTQLLTAFRQDVSTEQNPELRKDNLIFLDTVEAVRRFAVSSKQEANRPLERWQRSSRLVASRAAEYTMFTADRLKHSPELLTKFWDKIYTPLVLSGGYHASELDRLTSGFMAELAAGETISNLSIRYRRSDQEVFKGTPEEDVDLGHDLVIVSAGSEFPLQIKLQRSEGETFAEWQEASGGRVPQLELYYRRSVDELFNPQTGEPTSEMIQVVGVELPGRFGKRG